VIPSGKIVVAEYGNHRIRLVTPLGAVTTLAGSGNLAFADGTGTTASFRQPQGVAVIPSSGVIVVSDSYNHRIRLVLVGARPLVSTSLAAGSGAQGFQDGPRALARFAFPRSVAALGSAIAWAQAITLFSLVLWLAGMSLHFLGRGATPWGRPGAAVMRHSPASRR
jgi:hypothetical protein